MGDIVSRGKGRPKRRMYELTDSQVRWLIKKMESLRVEAAFTEDRKRAAEISERLRSSKERYEEIERWDRGVPLGERGETPE
jgi:DNA-binding PadR family transcriptional regulator